MAPSPDNRALVRRFYDELVNAGVLELVDELFAPEFVEHEELPSLPPDRRGVRDFLKMFRHAFPDLSFTVEHLVSEGDLVSVYVTMRGTHKEDFLGVQATGRKIAVRTFDLFRIRDGKFVEHWGVTDTMAMMQQLGVDRLGHSG
jgi:steroid delta-isomerase-like uncharacterized protein